MKKMFLILACLFTINVSYSQILIINKTDGSSSSFPIDSIYNITFSPYETIFSDDFESGSLTDYSVPSGHTPPELTEIASFSPTHSVTLKYPRNSYSTMGKTLSPSISSNIIAYNCKMMKNNLNDNSNMMIYLLTGDVNTFGTPKSVCFGLYTDSILVIIANDSNPSETVVKNLDVIQADRWYDFTIEYNFSTNKAAFFIDGFKVFESNYTVTSIDHFYFGDWSSGGSPMFDKVYFIDDIKVYKH